MKTYKLPELTPEQMLALIETIGPMISVRTTMASRSDLQTQRAWRLDSLITTLMPTIEEYFDRNEWTDHPHVS